MTRLCYVGHCPRCGTVLMVHKLPGQTPEDRALRLATAEALAEAVLGGLQVTTANFAEVTQEKTFMQPCECERVSDLQDDQQVEVVIHGPLDDEAAEEPEPREPPLSERDLNILRSVTQQDGVYDLADLRSVLQRVQARQ